MVDHDDPTKTIEYDPQQLKEFETRIRTFSEEEINKKIKQWLRRIEQLVALHNKRKGRMLYAELKVMVKVLREITASQEDVERLAISGAKLPKASREVDSVRQPLESYNAQELVEASDILFRFRSDEKSIEDIYEIVRQKLDLLPIDGMERINLDVGLTEAVGNAQRHGHDYNPDMPIELRYIYKDNKVLIQVTDQGKGFDAQSVLAKKKSGTAVGEARARYQEGGYGGLGIMMMLKCVDILEYNAKGNQVTLIKNLQNKQEN